MKTPLPPPSPELPDCSYTAAPSLIRPSAPTPAGSLYLSNLDDQHFLRFSIKYLYLFKAAVPAETLKQSLSRVLVDYYPLAGRLRRSCQGDNCKLEVDCNGEGALFAEASMDVTAEELLGLSRQPSRSWRKLLYRVEGQSFLNAPPLIVQVTNLRCGGMILCSAICHCLCDGIGSSQFLQAWAHSASRPHAHLPVQPIHTRHVLRPRDPPKIPLAYYPQYTRSRPVGSDGNAPPPADLHRYLQSQPLVPVSLTFAPSDVIGLKRRCVPSVKCTTFEVLAVHTWRSWVRALGLRPSIDVKLLFSVNIRQRLDPHLQPGFYGNGFVLGCAQTTVSDLCDTNLSNGVKLVQQAKSAITDDHVRSVIDLLEDRTAMTDMTTSFVISQWSRLGLEDLDFGAGRSVYMGPVTSDIYCLFLPVCGDPESVRVLVSVLEIVAKRFEYYMGGAQVEEGDEISAENGFHVGEAEDRLMDCRDVKI